MLIEEAIEQFGNSMNMPRLALDDSDKLALDIEEFGIQFFEKVEGTELLKF